MAQYPKITLTNSGLNMIAESQGGTELVFTKIVMGDGEIVGGEDIKVLVDVKHAMLTVPLQGFLNQGEGQVRLRFAVSNSTLETGFFAREIGVFAKLGESGPEQLYAYTNAGNKTDYMPDKSVPLDSQILDLYLIVGNAENISAVLDNNASYATKLDLQEHNADKTAHNEAFTAHNADKTAHANGIAGNAATATRLKPTLNGSRNQCWLLCKLPKNSYALVHYKILGAQYYDRYSTLEVVIKNGTGWCKYKGVNVNYQVSVKAYDTGSSIDVYLFAQNFDDIWEVFLEKNNAVSEFSYKKMGDATYVPTGTLVCDTVTGLGMDGVELFNGKQMATIDNVNAAGLNLLKRNTAYAVGDIAYSNLLPSWARLECVAAGTTASTSITIPNPVQAGILIADGAVTWIIDDIRDGSRVGDIAMRHALRDGYIKANGALLQAADYPRLVQFVIDNNLSVTETDWQASMSGMYVYDNAAKTLRVPDLRGVVLRGVDNGKGYDPARVLGAYQADDLKSHTHSITTYSWDAVVGGLPGQAAHYASGITGATGGAETRMKNIALIAQIKY